MCTTNRPVASRTLLGPLKTLTFWIGALDLDANAGGVGEDVELLDPDDGATHPPVVEAQPGDALGQGLDQVDVARIASTPDLVDQGLVADNAGQAIVVDSGIVDQRQIDINSNALSAVALVAVDADQHVDDEVADEHSTRERNRIGLSQRLDHGTFRHVVRFLVVVSECGYSSVGVGPGCAQPRC